MKKRTILAFIMAVVMTLTCVPFATVFAAEATDKNEASVTTQEVVSEEEKQTNDERLEEFMVASISDEKKTGDYEKLVDSLPAPQRRLYDSFLDDAQKICKGEKTSNGTSTVTAFEYKWSDIFGTNTVSLSKDADIFKDDGTTFDTKKVLRAVCESVDIDPDKFNLENICTIAYLNNPNSFFWYGNMFLFDTSARVSKFTSQLDNSVTRYEVKMDRSSFSVASVVADEYANKWGEQVQDVYGVWYCIETDSTKISSINTAVENARAIIEENKNKSDYDKIQSYVTRIKELSPYNFDASDGISLDKTNPWEIIWVFDNDPSTNVVCEGYAKAFKLLCDMTDFYSDDIYAYCVKGITSGDHMWNIVHMDDGRNYLVDVTNFKLNDPDRRLSLVKYLTKTGNTYIFYYYLDDSKSDPLLSYKYDNDTLTSYSANELEISATAYDSSCQHIIVKHEAVSPTCSNDGCKAHYQCERCKKYFTDSEGTNETTYDNIVRKATGHSGQSYIAHITAKAATCTQTGVKQEHYKCGQCGKLFADYDGTIELTQDDVFLPIDSNNHVSCINRDGYGPTLDNIGTKPYKKCNACNKLIDMINGEEISEAITLKKGQCGDNVFAVLDNDGVLTISGTGDMYDYFGSFYSPWYDDMMNGDVKQIIVDEGVTSIGKECGLCYDNDQGTNVTYIKLPSTILRIGENNFNEGIENLTIDYEGQQSRLFSMLDEDTAAIISQSGVTITYGQHDIEYHPAKAANCTENGNSQYWYCKDLNKYYSDYELTQEIAKDSYIIAATGHDTTKTDAVAPTCAEDGNIEYYHCSTCDKYFSDAACTNEIANGGWVLKGGHDITHAAAKNQTCTEDGNKEYYHCSRCNKYFKDAACTAEYGDNEWVMATHGHRLGNLTKGIQPTCTKEGKKSYYYCGNCKQHFAEDKTTIITDNLTIPKTEHNLTKTERKEPTCAEDGNKEYYYCDVCNRYFEDSGATKQTTKAKTIDPTTGHKTIALIKEEAPTCTEEGHSEYYKCTACNKLYSDQACTKEITEADVKIPAKGHTLVKQEAMPATCTKTGQKEHYKCSGCSKLFSDASGKNAISTDDIRESAKRHTPGNDYYSDDTHHWKECTICGTQINKSQHSGAFTIVQNGDKITKCKTCIDTKPITIGKTSITSIANVANGVTIKWNKTAGAQSYCIYRKSGNGNYALLTKVGASTLTYTDIKAVAGAVNTYYVLPMNGNEKGTYTTKSIVRLANVKAAVSNVNNGLCVKWNKVAGAQKYTIYRKYGSGGWSAIATVSSSASSYTDTAVRNKNGYAYTYCVKAVNGSASSTYTQAAYYRLTTPVINYAANNGTRRIYARWNRNTTATGYQVLYKTTGFSKTLTIKGNNYYSRNLTSLTKGKYYYVYVRSYKTVGKTNYYSAWSAYKRVRVTK